MSQNHFTPKPKHGKVKGTTWYKTIRGSVHALRNPPAICFDISDVSKAEQGGVISVDVLDSETGTHYKTELEIIRTRGFPVRRGWGEQIGLPLYAFLRTGSKLADLPTGPPARQLSFGEVPR